LGRGTTIELWLPIATDGIEKTAKAIGRGFGCLVGKGQLCILAVDDDNLVLANVTVMLGSGTQSDLRRFRRARARTDRLDA